MSEASGVMVALGMTRLNTYQISTNGCSYRTFVIAIEC